MMIDHFCPIHFLCERLHIDTCLYSAYPFRDIFLNIISLNIIPMMETEMYITFLAE